MRLERGLIAAEVAARAGVSPSFLSQVERGHAHPSLKVLIRLASGLEVSVTDLVTENDAVSEARPGRRQPTATVVRSTERKILRRSGGPEYQLLSPDLTGQIEMILVELAPGQSSGADISHEGEEQIMVIEGTVVMRVDSETYELNRGDSIRFDSGLPHGSANLSARPATFLSAATPASF